MADGEGITVVCKRNGQKKLPCNITFLPIVLDGAGGFSFEHERSRAVLDSAVFSLGIVVTRCALGALAAIAGTALLPLRTFCLGVVGAALMAMGLFCLGLCGSRCQGGWGMA